MNENSPIPFVDLSSQYSRMRAEVMAKIDEVISRGSFIQGEYVRRFEREFADHHASPFALGCSNGTSAISIALEALGVGPGDEVITVDNTFIATAEAICHVGATPVFVDIDPDTYQMDAVAVEKAITPRTKALIPVHLYGNPADLEPIQKIAESRKLYLIEDAAQAHLATYRGRPIGTWGDAATFSFYPGKNLGAYGDAGMIFCKSAKLHEKMQKLINHGRTEKYKHDLVGYNQRMDEIQAAVLSLKLKHLPAWTNRRRQLAALYRSALESRGFKAMRPTTGSEPVYHLFVVEVSNREEVVKELSQRGISCLVHYPIPLHQQPAFARLGYRSGDFPRSERIAQRIVSLPLCGELSDANARRVVDAFLAVAKP